MPQAEGTTEYTYEDYASKLAVNRLHQTCVLVNQSMRITFPSGICFELAFIDRNKVAWQNGAESGTDWCEAVEVAPYTYFIDMTFTHQPRQSLTFIVNVQTRQALSIRTIMRAGDVGKEPRAVHEFSPGVLGDPALPPAGGAALAIYAAIGALVGLAAVGVTRAVYAIEDGFGRLPIHWMWWPALGGVVVGAVGWLEPRTLGVGYDNITGLVSGHIVGTAAVVLCTLKLVSWLFALGSGTSGGTLAPLFTMGGGLGAVLGAACALGLPAAGVDPRVAAVVGMAALFAGASRALLTSVVFAFEATQSQTVLLPLLAGCSAAFMVSCLLMRTTIMTEKIVRRGVGVPDEFLPDTLEQLPVHAAMSRDVVSLPADRTLREVRAWLDGGAPGSGHQGFPVVDAAGVLRGVVTRRDLLGSAPGETRVGELVVREPIVVHPDDSLRAAADCMTLASVGRLPVVSRDAAPRLVGIVSRSDLVGAHRLRLQEASERRREMPRQDVPDDAPR